LAMMASRSWALTTAAKNPTKSKTTMKPIGLRPPFTFGSSLQEKDVRFDVPLYARPVLAKAAALVPASRPNTAPFIKPDPPG
jgi:hypothetical protein